MQLAAKRAGNKNIVSARNDYLRASLMYSLAQWPLPSTQDSIKVLNKSYTALYDALSYTPQFSQVCTQIPYTNNGETVFLNGVFASPNPQQQLPLIVVTTGLGAKFVLRFVRV